MNPIDLSPLTENEVNLLRSEPDVLTSGEIPVALYMRYSSERQTEQSIEGQLRDAIAFCKLKGFRITAVYVDRATSAHENIQKRINFLRMIDDSAKRLFSFVVVWKLDRFSRNRTDSAVYKMRLKKNGVRVLSVTENISENPEGIILESVLEGMAEFYSAELSQKITRGLRETALKCKSTGGHIPLGFKSVNGQWEIDPLTAPAVKRAFDLYASGESVAEICRDLNSRGYRTTKNAPFNKNSFKTLLKNKRYIGTYIYGGLEIENGLPAIVDKKTFREVQRRLKENGAAPGKGKATVDYLLSGKLFCGNCGSLMIGESGKSHTGKVYYYYKCAANKAHKGCNKRSLPKNVIEDWVVQDAMQLLTDKVIDELAHAAVHQSEEELKNNTPIPALEAKQKELNKNLNNLIKALENGLESSTVANRVKEIEKELKEVNAHLLIEEKEFFRLDYDQVYYWLLRFKDGDVEDEVFRRQLVDLLINSVTVYYLPDGDFEITTTYNLTSTNTKTVKSSDLKAITPPLGVHPNPICLMGTVFFQTKKHSLN